MRVLKPVDLTGITGASIVKFPKEKKNTVYKKKDVPAMRESIKAAIEQSLNDVQMPGFAGSAMVKSYQGGFQLKIGYGKRLEQIAPIIYCKTLEIAIQTMNKALSELKNGDYDKILSELLKSYQKKAAAGKAVKAKKKA